MKKTCLTLILLNALCAGGALIADTTTIVVAEDSLPETGFVHIGAGVYHQPLDEFNAALRNRGIGELSEEMLLLTIGFYGYEDRGRFGLDFETIWSGKAQAQGDSGTISGVNLRGFSLAFRGGYNLLDQTNVAIMPLLGFGYFQHAYDFHPRFNDILDRTVDENLIVRNLGLLLTAGLNVHIHSNQSDKRKDGTVDHYMIGMDFDAGVNYYPLRRTKFKGNTVSGSPDMSPYGIYARVSINFGDKDEKKPEEPRPKQTASCMNW